MFFTDTVPDAASSSPMMHTKPAPDAAACFIKLKQFEEDLLTSVAEGLGLGMSGRDVFSLLEVEP